MCFTVNPRPAALIAVLAVALTVTLGGGMGRADENLGSGSVLLTVLGPDGRPLADHALDVYPAGPGFPQDEVGRGPTDDQGRLSLSLPAGLHRLRVVAPGVGFGATGTLEVGPGKTPVAELPPLAPFARISGTVAPALLRPGETVHVETFPPAKSTAVPPAPVDSQGRFQLTDVWPGQNQLSLVGAEGRNYYAQVRVAPGETHDGVVFTAPLVPAFVPPPDAAPPTFQAKLRGTVMDDTGRPVADADVYAAVPDFQRRLDTFSRLPLFQLPPPLMTRTDAGGHYVFPNVTLATPNYTYTLPVAAARAGLPPAIAYARVEPGRQGDLQADLILPTRHTGLTVRVLLGGKPLADAPVSLGPEAGVSGIGGWNWAWDPAGSPWPARIGGAASDAMGSLFFLSGTTGPDGVARFADLTPGLWTVQAQVGKYPDIQSTSIRGVAVRAGQGDACTLSLDTPPARPSSVQVLTPDGQPLAGRSLGLGTAYAAWPNSGGGTGLTLDTQGKAPLPPSLLTPGLWRLDVPYRDTPQQASPFFQITAEPYDAAGVLLAVSPALSSPAVLTLRAVHHGPGRVRVRLEDQDGRPAAGTVVISGFANGPDYAATVDARGEAVFPDMTSGQYTVQGYLAGHPSPPTLSNDGRPLPPDAALTGQAWVFPQTVTVSADSETPLTLRAQNVVYVRGRLPAPAPNTSVTITCDLPLLRAPGISFQEVGSCFDADRREFVYGPLLPGRATFSAYQFDEALRRNVQVASATATVTAGTVTHIPLTPTPPGPDAGKSLAEANPITGTVLLHDGRTPAWGALAVLSLPDWSGFAQAARADALGHLDDKALTPPQTAPYGRPTRPAPTGSDPPGPTLVAWLPGQAGATILPYVRGLDARIILPSPLSAPGRVTVGGQSVASLPGAFRVRAEYQGRGKLNDLLSLDVTAGPDGSFTLDGLTPGAYRVQAARDGIWLSATQTLTVGTGPPLPSLTLDIAPPGAPVVLHLTDSHGRPLPGQAVTPDVPPGPLADILWPPTITADGAGDLRLNSLTAGRHTFAMPGSNFPPLVVTVPPLSAAPERRGTL